MNIRATLDLLTSCWDSLKVGRKGGTGVSSNIWLKSRSEDEGTGAE